MNQESSNYSAGDEDLKLWRFLGYTGYVISRLRELELARFGLTPEQAYVLDILSISGGSTTMADIADMTFRQHHTISTLIARMEQRGLVEKNHCADDKRRYTIIITRKGRELFQKVTRDSIKMAFSVLSAADKRELGSILSRLLSKAYELHGRPSPFTAKPIPCSV